MHQTCVWLNVSVYCRLLATHYPHLCLVEDCLDEELSALALPPAVICRPGKLSCTVNNLQQGKCWVSLEFTPPIACIIKSIQSFGPLKALYTSPPGRPVHSDTNSSSLGSILAMQLLRAKIIHSHFHNGL